MTVTPFRSPSITLFEVRIFSARCFGVYVWGVAYFDSSVVGTTSASGAEDRGDRSPPRGAPHSPQNLLPTGLDDRHAGHSNARGGAPHSPQNFTPAGFSCWHRGHCIPEPPWRALLGDVPRFGRAYFTTLPRKPSTRKPHFPEKPRSKAPSPALSGAMPQRRLHRAEDPGEHFCKSLAFRIVGSGMGIAPSRRARGASRSRVAPKGGDDMVVGLLATASGHLVRPPARTSGRAVRAAPTRTPRAAGSVGSAGLRSARGASDGRSAFSSSTSRALRRCPSV